MIADAFRWSQDDDGEWLCIRTKEAQPFLENVKQGKQYTVEIKEYRETRTRTANNFLWSCLDKCAEKLHTTKEELYRKYIPSVGTFRDWDLPEDKVGTFCHAWESQGIGWVTERVDYAGDGNLITIRAYYGSSTYTKKRMSRLIDMVVEDAKELGIDCMTEKERALLIDKWEPVKA